MEVSIDYIKVLQFATQAHKDQKRKYTGEDYITHPIEVARMVIGSQGGDMNMVLAALLHDVLEDTAVTHESLRKFLHGTLCIEDAEDVLALVVELTDVYTTDFFPKLNRKYRKQFEAERLSIASDRAKAIKRADISHNSESINEHDPKFAKVFLAEKEILLKLIA